MVRLDALLSAVTAGQPQTWAEAREDARPHREAIAPEMFDRWLTLWAETARAMLSAADAEAVIAKSERIAESLQLALFFRLPASAPRAA